MRKNYKLKLFTALVVAGVSIGGVNAIHPTLTSTTIIAENSDNWVEVQNENGIKVFFSKVEANGDSYLRIKFENTTSNTINFKWSLNKNSKDLLGQEYTSIDALQSTLYDVTMLIPINNGESFNDFSLINNLK